MDSLVANYASSDDDDEEVWKESATSAPPTKPSSLSLPPPKPSSSLPSHRLSSSLPPPKSHNPSTHHPRLPSAHQTHGLDADGEDEEDNARKHTKNLPSSTMSKPPSSFFSSLPPPRSSSTTSSSSLFSAIPPPKSANPPSVDPNPRKIVQFKPPIDPSVFKSSNSDEDDDRERKPSKDSSSAPPKALSSMLPAPKNSLCLAPAPSSAASRRSVLQAGVPAVNPTEGFGQGQEQETTDYENYADAPEMVNPGGFGPEQDMSGYQSSGIYDGNLAGVSMIPVVDGSLQPGSSGGGVESSWDPSYGGSGDYGSHAVNWSDRSAAMPALEIRDMGRIAGKRGRNQTPTEIVEVKQDELMKNRPREDQTKLTGIAFGPSYQPVSSGKGAKPSKLHKRKHQIGSLYFDMKQKEMELAERRSKGLLTKAETHAKYGW